MKSLKKKQTENIEIQEESVKISSRTETNEITTASQTVFEREGFKLILKLKLRGLWHLEELPLSRNIFSTFNRCLNLPSVISKV